MMWIFLLLIFFNAQLTAWYFPGPAKGGCLPHPDSCFWGRNGFAAFKLLLLSVCIQSHFPVRLFPLLAGAKKMCGGLPLKASKKMRKRKYEKITRCVREPDYFYLPFFVNKTNLVHGIYEIRIVYPGCRYYVQVAKKYIYWHDFF